MTGEIIDFEAKRRERAKLPPVSLSDEGQVADIEEMAARRQDNTGRLLGHASLDTTVKTSTTPIIDSADVPKPRSGARGKLSIIPPIVSSDDAPRS